jgi:hypothetical protein
MRDQTLFCENKNRRKSLQNSVSCDPLKCTSRKHYIVKCVEDVLHKQLSQINVCEIKYTHAHLKRKSCMENERE